jgi:hypothetical protein
LLKIPAGDHLDFQHWDKLEERIIVFVKRRASIAAASQAARLFRSAELFLTLHYFCHRA